MMKKVGKLIQSIIQIKDIYYQGKQKQKQKKNNSNQNKNQKNNDHRLQDLYQQIQACSYHQQNKIRVVQALQVILPQFPKLKTGIIHFNNLKNIQASGYIPVSFKQQIYYVYIFMFFPDSFPFYPPIIKIKNISRKIHQLADQYYVNQFYKQKPTNDNCFILKLQSQFNWNPSLNPLQMIYEAQNMMKHNFPFIKKIKNQYQHNLYDKKQQQENQMYLKKNMNKNNPLTYTGQNYNKLKFQGIFQLKVQKQLSKISEELEYDLQILKSQLKTIQQDKLKEIGNLQSLTIINYSLNNSIKSMKNRIKQLESFIKNNQYIIPSQINIEQILTIDQNQKIIFDIYAQNQALKECNYYLEQMLSDQNITFQQYIKLKKKLEEEKFYNTIFMQQKIK